VVLFAPKAGIGLELGGLGFSPLLAAEEVRFTSCAGAARGATFVPKLDVAFSTARHALRQRAPSYVSSSGNVTRSTAAACP